MTKPSATAALAAPEFAIVPLAHIVSSPTNPRKSFDIDKLNELAGTIKASGVHTPILLRYLPPARLQDTFTDRKKGQPLPKYEIVAGERRYRASVIAAVDTIPALIRAMSDEQALEVQMIENLQRDDLSELEEAEGYQQLCDLTGITKEAIGAKIGRSRRYVYDRLRLLKLQPLARTALREGKVSATAALAIAAVHDGDLQAKALAHALSTNYAGDHPSTRTLQTWMRLNVMLELGKAPFDTKATTLHPSAGACTSCPKRTGADPDIFAETQGPDSCCDAPCYRIKADAAREQAYEKFKAQGIKIIDGDDAEELHMYGERFDGYSPVSQTREDTADGKPTSLLDLLGKKGQAAVGLVAIEHPGTKTVQAYVDTDKAEAWLLANKLVVDAPSNSNSKATASHNAEVTLKRLLATRDHRIKEAGQEATQNAVQDAVLKAAPRLIGNSLLTDTFLRAYLTAFVNPYSPGVMAKTLDCERDEIGSDEYREKLEGRISHAERSVLLRTFVLVLLDTAYDNIDCDAATALLHDAEIDLHETLCKQDSPSLADICTAAEQVESAAINAEIEKLKEQLKPKTKPPKPASTQPPLAQPTESAKVKPKAKPKTPKLTPDQAQLGIADAMQKDEEVAAKAAMFTKGQRVKVLSAEPLFLQKYIGKIGKIKQACGDNWDVSFHGGIAEFEAHELEAVPA
jgi:ParB/RepB/Spo0J family partition protein